jgi:hypothetical protein
MVIKKYCIYNLDFSYTRISQITNLEVDFRGSLSYHTKDIQLLADFLKEDVDSLELDAVNIFLSFQIQRHIDIVLKDMKEEEIVNQRPIILNRLKMIVRRELINIGLEFIDFKQISLWSHGSSARFGCEDLP